MTAFKIWRFVITVWPTVSLLLLLESRQLPHSAYSVQAVDAGCRFTQIDEEADFPGTRCWEAFSDST